jgi:hypothetical protein
MRRFLLLKLILVTFILSVPSLLPAQDVASMTGVVTDTTGAIVPGADVTLVNTTTNASYHAFTNDQGSYTISNVPPGPGYKMTVSITGFEPLVISDIYLNVARTRTQNASLHVGGVSQAIEVSASSQNVTINTTDATVGNNFDVKLVNDLPVQNRDSPSALFTLQPGVTLDGAVTGARTDQNNVTLDGLDVNDIATGQEFVIVGDAPVDSIQEFRGTVAGQLSNSGPGGGGQFQLVTKSGTNAFHGNLNEYHRDTSTVANEWFNNNAGVPRAPLIRNQFGGNIGGPIIKDKLFFFFNYYNSRIIQSSQTSRTVPLDSFRNGNVSYIKDGCAATSRQNTTPQCIGSLNSAQVANLDPQHVGFNQDLLTFINQRYPHANDLTRGDGINTGGYRFNSPRPDFQTDYVGRIDYKLTPTMSVFGRFNIARENRDYYSAIQFPGDPVTSPFIDRSHAWVVGHTWTIGSNKVNRFIYGKTVTDLSFPNTYYPLGTNTFLYGGDGTGGTILSDAYQSPINAQSRIIPIPQISDDFTWQKGSHNLTFGGYFKFIKSYSDTKLDYNTATIGLGGNTNELDPSLRPADIRTAGTTASRTYDSAFALALGRVGAIDTNYNYDNKGDVIAQGTGSIRRYRYYQTQVYFGDTWKVTPSLTVSYGANYQFFSVPYETNGLESVEQFTFDQYFAARQKQSAAGIAGNDAVPFMTYVLGGKANHGPGLYKPSYKDIAPRFAFAYSPSFDHNTVFNGGAGIVYDRTVINAVQYQQDQHSYLFQQENNIPYGTPGDPTGSLATDPRLGANNALPSVTPPPAPKTPYQPFVDDTGAPYGLGTSQFSTAIDPALKTPYSIAFNFGFQHEFPGQLVLKTSYVGRLGRRLLAQADASQLLDFPDAASGQLLSNAFANMTTQHRAGVTSATPQPWFENQSGSGATQFFYDALGGLVDNGDFADFVQQLAAYGYIAPNVGMAAQFAENTFYTNKGSSTYHGLLTTLQKNFSHGLQFDVNYTWAHSIDNVSLIANQGAASGYGFICDARDLRICRGNSDFDVAHYISADFTYSLPFGRGRTFGANTPFWLNEVVGGWDLSGITQWHSGIAWGTVTSAFVAGYANDAPAIFNGDTGAISSHVHKTEGGSVTMFADPARAKEAFTGPVGFTIGSRNNLRGPQYFNQDLGLAKTFPVVADKVNLKFRADAFNAFNHPNFTTPTNIPNTYSLTNADITAGTFGQITSTVPLSGGSPGSGARVLQFALRLEF